MMKDYYAVLGLAKGATDEEIKSAYRKLAMKHHPDREGGDEIKFKEIKEAYETLSDAAKRKSYDSKSTGSKYKFEDFDEILRKYKFYDDLAREKKSQHSHNRDYDGESNIKSVTIDIPLKDAFHGAEKNAQLYKFGPTVKLDIPPGVQQDQRVGSFTQGSVVYYVLANLKNDPDFDYDDGRYDIHSKGNVYVDVGVSPFKMICGDYVEFTCLDGGTVQVRIPEGLGAGKMLKIKERGYWTSEKREHRGDCFLRVTPVIKKLGEYPLDDIRLFMEKYAEVLGPKPA